jgi:hypothetical protein
MSKEVDVESFNRGKISGIGGNGSRDSIILRLVTVTRRVTIASGEGVPQTAASTEGRRRTSPDADLGSAGTGMECNSWRGAELVAQIRLKYIRKFRTRMAVNTRCVCAGNGSCIVEANRSDRELLGQQG